MALKLEELREEKSEIMLKIAERENLKERLKEMNEFLEEKEIGIERFDDVLVRKLIESIEINGENILVEFKSLRAERKSTIITSNLSFDR